MHSDLATENNRAKILADIQSSTGVALVNLVWRHLASRPAVLQWCWQTLKPHYLSGAIPAAAWLLRESVKAPQLTPLNRDEQCRLTRTISKPAVVDAMLTSYERGNAQNLVAMCHLELNARPAEYSGRSLATAPTLNAAQQRAEQADRVEIDIPPLPELNELAPNLQQHIATMSAIWVPAQYGAMTPSVFRHLAHWPELLALLSHRLNCWHHNDNATLAAASRDAIDLAEYQAARLNTDGRPAQPALSAADQQWLTDTLALFINAMISRGVVIVPAMRTLLASATS